MYFILQNMLIERWMEENSERRWQRSPTPSKWYNESFMAWANQRVGRRREHWVSGSSPDFASVVPFTYSLTTKGVPRWLSGKESACQYRRHRRFRFDFWVEEIPWRRKWQPTSIFLPGTLHGQRSLAGRLQCTGSLRVGHDWAHMSTLTLSCSYETKLS